MILVFLGPPGAGKGTQCKSLVDRYRWCHLSSGDILRRERKEGSELGRKAQSYMDSGKLVPDDLIVAMMIKELNTASCGKGFILDGFPRTQGQAEELDKALQKMGRRIDVVLNLEVDDARLEQRVTGRRTCPVCGTAYHIVFNPPKRENVCDKDGQPLVQRPDDTAEVVCNRIQAYHQQTAPLISYYSKQKLVKNIDGNVPIDEVTKSMFRIVDGLSA